jgi:ABC-type antimicrobial peptide transport system permease subunit
MVLVESATLALVAIALALPLAWVMTMGLVSGQKASLGFTVEFLYPWGLVPLVGLAALFVAGVAALVPARRAGRLEPVAALRFD